MPDQVQERGVEARQKDGRLLLKLEGAITLRSGCASCPDAVAAIEGRQVSSVAYDAERLGEWDSSLLAFLLQIERLAAANTITTDRSGLPTHVRTLVEMALTSGREREPREKKSISGILAPLGVATLNAWRDFLAFVDFTGDVTIAVGRLLRGKSRMRWRDFWYVMQTVSIEALPIVCLISFLVGLIIAFLGAVVLIRFGAEFAVAYLVGYGMLREMGAVMAGIIMAGRTGAAFAAQIGSMKVTEEVDALKTLGISPIDFLVLPRLITLILMMPLLTIFADVIGIFGGYLVATGMLGVPPNQFFTGINFVTGMNDLFLGIFKGGVFGMLIAVSGCLRGLQCGRSADAVGVAVTRAVVLGITLIIFSNAVIDYMATFFNV